MIRKLITIAAALAGLALTLGTTAASASMIGDPGVYLSSTPTLTLAAPNNVTAGKPAVLKKCLGSGDCTVFANLKGTETFDFVANTTKVFAPDTVPTGFEMRLHGTSWCVTNRGSAVTFETCANFASQLWNGTEANTTGVVVSAGVLENQKTDLNLTHTAVQAFAPVTVAASLTHWGNAS